MLLLVDNIFGFIEMVCIAVRCPSVAIKLAAHALPFGRLQNRNGSLSVYGVIY